MVDKDYRKIGIDKKLMQQIENWGKEKGGSAVGLRSSERRKGAHEFYQQIGYEKVKKQLTFRKEL